MRIVGIIPAAAALLVAILTLPAHGEVTKAPYMTNADHALKLASESGREAIIYFFSET